MPLKNGITNFTKTYGKKCIPYRLKCEKIIALKQITPFARKFSRDRVGRDYVMAVTGSMWLLRELRGTCCNVATYTRLQPRTCRNCHTDPVTTTSVTERLHGKVYDHSINVHVRTILRRCTCRRPTFTHLNV